MGTTSTFRGLLRRVTAVVMCAALTMMVGRASARLIATFGVTAESETETRSASTNAWELLHSEPEPRRATHRRMRAAESSGSVAPRSPRLVNASRAEHLDFLQTHQLNAIGCPLLC